nr:integrase arm-type DNA-binding domain-containing protein [Pseudomonas sp. Irchel s3b2]
MSLGTYPEISLRDARALRDEARALVARSIDPRVHRQLERNARRQASEKRLRSACSALASRFNWPPSRLTARALRLRCRGGRLSYAVHGQLSLLGRPGR